MDGKQKKLKSDDPLYFKTWWNEHGAEVNRQRKLRYRKDVSYRAGIARRTRVVRAKEQIKRRELVKKGLFIDRRHLRLPAQPRRVTLNGKIILAIPLSMLASKIGYSLFTVGSWHRSGLLPKATLSIKGRYYVSEEYVAKVSSAVLKWQESGSSRVNLLKGFIDREFGKGE